MEKIETIVPSRNDEPHDMKVDGQMVVSPSGAAHPDGDAMCEAASGSRSRGTDTDCLELTEVKRGTEGSHEGVAASDQTNENIQNASARAPKGIKERGKLKIGSLNSRVEKSTKR